MISAEQPHAKRYADVHGRKMAYIEVGSGDPIVFLHGNPTSSYLWRNVIPHLERVGRCIAPDRIGMGDSEKLDDSGPDSYRFVEHRHYLDGLLEALGVDSNVTFVVCEFCRGWLNQTEITVAGAHFIQEDSPDEIGEAIADWLGKLG